MLGSIFSRDIPSSQMTLACDNLTQNEPARTKKCPLSPSMSQLHSINSSPGMLLSVLQALSGPFLLFHDALIADPQSPSCVARPKVEL